MSDIKEYSVSVELVQPASADETPSAVHVQVQSPGENGVAWHWYPQINDFNRRAARRFFGADGVSLAEDDRDDVIDRIAAKVRPMRGLRFPADKPKEDDPDTEANPPVPEDDPGDC